MKLVTKLSFTMLMLQLSFGQWTTVATDPSGDGANPTLLDGLKFEYSYDKQNDSIDFRFTVSNIGVIHESAFGINVMVNIPGGGGTFNFWGADNANPYHKLLTVWVTGSAPSNYTGTIGIADANGVSGNNFTNLSTNNISINLDKSKNEISLKLDRKDLISDQEMGESLEMTTGVAGAVGSNQFWNDDLYSPTGSMTIQKGNVGIENKNQIELRDIFTSKERGQWFLNLPRHGGLKKITISNIDGIVITKKIIEDQDRNKIVLDMERSGVYLLTLERLNGTSFTKTFSIP